MGLGLCLFLLGVVEKPAVVAFLDDHLLDVSCVILGI
jgi:hypothetical protein